VYSVITPFLITTLKLLGNNFVYGSIHSKGTIVGTLLLEEALPCDTGVP
jgi:hypothetical protein